MNIGSLYEGNLKGEFVFSPYIEMLASMHVISKPEHHLDRMKWMESIMGKIPEWLVNDIRNLSSLTNEWLIPMDFPYISSFSEPNIIDSLDELAYLGLSKWNKVFQLYNKRTDVVEKSSILQTMRDYHDIIFIDEIKYLQPFLIRIIKREMERFKEEGLLNRINKIHERIEINENTITLHKNIEYRFDTKEIKKIIITASTFLSPHLMLYEEKGVIGLTVLVPVEEKKGEAPADLVNLLKALGDTTRMRILHEMHKDPATTQSLAVKLKLTEAGISKHLKILHNSGLVEKQRSGNYIYYSLCNDAIDYIPYKLYEYIMR